ncbi:MAG: protein kinase [Candidatus Sericytochromatia bacterium]|nr:protein kinase [Candidatus Sericytochromatia bacterium]
MSAQKKYCLECFAIIDAELETCSQCGYVQPTEYNPLYLKPPFRLNRQYVIGKVLGHGGFGITYLGFDRHLNTRVAIKEYFPAEFASRAPDGQQVIPYSGDKSELFKLGRDKFIAEARLLASLRSPHIVRIRHFFEECNTAYFIMEYLEGNTLSQHVANQGGRIKPEKIKGLLLPLLEALEEVHAKNSFHRDIKPDNVYVTSKGQPILLDFGAARQQMSGATTNLLAFLTPGFAPAEQYSTNGIQGPWTDIYALAATMYYALTGNIPPVPHDRMMGDQELIRPSALGVKISPKDEEWLIQGLALKWSQRPENITQWRKLIEAADNTAAPMNNFKRSEEENFMRIAILPRLVSRFLTPTAEAEIHESAGFMEISRERVETLIEEALMMTGSTRRDPDAEKRKEQERRKQLEEDLKRRQARDAADEAHRQEQRLKQEAEKKRQDEEELQRKQDEEKRTTERAQQETARREEALRQSQKQPPPPSKSPWPKPQNRKHPAKADPTSHHRPRRPLPLLLLQPTSPLRQRSKQPHVLPT